MKINKQRMEEIKQKIKNIKEKVTEKKIEKVPKKYYTLLILMLMLSALTLTKNIKQYKDSNKEEYKEYYLKNETANTTNIRVEKYITAESSIKTEEANIEEIIEVISTEDNKEKINEKTKKYIMPINGVILKEYAQEKLVYSETLGMWKTHPGIDVKAKLNEKVKSVSDGIVLLVGKDSFYGNVVKIIDDTGYTFVYSNLDNNILVEEGDNVKQGEIIGTVGVSATGELADEVHLHFEVLKDKTQVNPLDLIS